MSDTGSAGRATAPEGAQAPAATTAMLLAAAAAGVGRSRRRAAGRQLVDELAAWVGLLVVLAPVAIVATAVCAWVELEAIDELGIE
ncbi:hypothetical protein MHY85_19055 [Cellulomonas sp. ACRRI]|uniref:hypothetical protein n=2 Tax=unclassified Cellulomonas TaxID=2620175 RepID=UPI001EF38F52|nr:hypothetical protein [Cellulomonas sp. ACRRI]MBW0255832.1 hypothetical protein [Cellulomonas sp. PS-H5]MCG7288061.1 hypothetical protein [Cellulomonas sp. ACRRI]